MVQIIMGSAICVGGVTFLIRALVLGKKSKQYDVGQIFIGSIFAVVGLLMAVL